MSLFIKKGGTSKNSFEFTDSNGDPVDLTGATFQFLIKEKYGGLDVYRYTDSNIVDPTLGIVSMVIPSSLTVNFPQGKHPSEIKLTNSEGEPYYSQVLHSRVESVIDQ